MTESVDLKSIERRPMQYWFIDGLPELAMGLLWIVWGGAWLLGLALPRGKVWSVYWTFVPLLLTLSGVAATWVVKKLKARITFPRAGYVEWQAPTGGQRLAAMIVAAFTAAAAVALVTLSRRVPDLASLAAPGMGVLLSLGFVVASRTQRAPHLLLLAALSLVLGFAFGALDTGWEAMNWMLLALGVAMMIVGAVRLRLFLLKNPLETTT